MWQLSTSRLLNTESEKQLIGDLLLYRYAHSNVRQTAQLCVISGELLKISFQGPSRLEGLGKRQAFYHIINLPRRHRLLPWLLPNTCGGRYWSIDVTMLPAKIHLRQYSGPVVACTAQTENRIK